MAATSASARSCCVVATLALAGCGLFLAEPNEPLCRFDGDETACGACLKEQCVDAVGACCGTTTCRAALDTCAAPARCAATFASAGAVAMQSCAERACAAACGVVQSNDAGADARRAEDSGDAAAEVDGATKPDASGTTNKTHCAKLGAAACDCSIPSASDPKRPNDATCDENVGFAAVCCADTTWPNAGSKCSCLTADCDRPGGGGCSCSLGTTGDSCNDGTVCCVPPSGGCFCTYQGPTCALGYRQVARCDGQTIGCRNGKRVTSCSVPR